MYRPPEMFLLGTPSSVLSEFPAVFLEIKLKNDTTCKRLAREHVDIALHGSLFVTNSP